MILEDGGALFDDSKCKPASSKQRLLGEWREETVNGARYMQVGSERPLSAWEMLARLSSRLGYDICASHRQYS